MAIWTRREVTTTRVEYVLPSPTNGGELGKTIAAIEADLPEDQRSWDSTVKVEARDDEIVLSYEKGQEVRNG